MNPGLRLQSPYSVHKPQGLRSLLPEAHGGTSAVTRGYQANPGWKLGVSKEFYPVSAEVFPR